MTYLQHSLMREMPPPLPYMAGLAGDALSSKPDDRSLKSPLLNGGGGGNPCSNAFRSTLVTLISLRVVWRRVQVWTRRTHMHRAWPSATHHHHHHHHHPHHHYRYRRSNHKQHENVRAWCNREKKRKRKGGWG